MIFCKRRERFNTQRGSSWRIIVREKLFIYAIPVIKIAFCAVTIAYAVLGLGRGEIMSEETRGVTFEACLSLAIYLDLLSIWIFVMQYFRTSLMFSHIFQHVKIDQYIDQGASSGIKLNVSGKNKEIYESILEQNLFENGREKNSVGVSYTGNTQIEG